MLTNVPLMIVPLILYNIVVVGFFGTEPVSGGIDQWAEPVLTIPMISSADGWKMSLGDLMITFALILLFFEIMKSTRIGASSIIDHLLSTFVFIAFLVEFLLVKSAAHSVFFILMVITFVDVIAGFSVSIRSATRDVSVGGPHGGY